MKVLLAGSSGLVGGELLNALISDPMIEPIYALGRRPPARQSAKLHFIKTDFERLHELPIPELSAVGKVDCAFCCLGTTIKKAGSQPAFYKVDHDFVLSFAQLAKGLGARRFLLVSAMGADPQSAVFYNRVKGETERDVARLGFESFVSIRPSLLLGKRGEKRLAEEIAISLASVFSSAFIGPLANVRPIEAKVVARVLLSEAKASAPGNSIITNQMLHNF